MTAEKENKTYTITEDEKERYRLDGFDIKDDDGNVIAYGCGKMVSYEEHEKLKAACEAAKKELEELKAAEPKTPKKPNTKKEGE